ncbi:Nucleotide-binding universal stress protein, UspA family [Natronoarchaeum philippinense]|uniref:Nucleotide-binding universal stress protein, UspA family n=1 Tax=Natronoarchaeum philippinense TaxID=558529 RepID=A0A285NVG6_NATPI|nr:universal stress protein [Natronoarchaeum philippinense]SNZ12913.1 Nucleotide-binding universal stress protein, UspA family [Natronoarchaeum philippinense]
MIESILVPVDESPQSAAAFEYALDEFPDAAITALHVIHLPEGYWAAFSDSDTGLPGYDNATTQARELLDGITETADERDREVDTTVETGDAGREIVDYAIENDIDQIVMGSHGRDRAGRLLFGSVAEKVVRNAPMTVVVVHETE